MVRPVLVCALSLVLAAGTGPATASTAVAPVRGAPSVSAVTDAAVPSMSLSPQVVRPSGVTTVPVTVEFHFTQTSTDTVLPSPTRVVLRPVSLPAPAGVLPVLSIVTPQLSGTSTDGIWRGSIPVPASAAGRWQVECVMIRDTRADPPGRCIVPTQRPTLQVIGTHLPSMSVSVRPYPIPLTGTTQVSARLIDSQTGAALPGREIIVSTHWQTCIYEGTCSGEGLFGGTYTDARGRFTAAIETRQSPLLCVQATIPGVNYVDADAPTLATDCRAARHTVRLSGAAAGTRVPIARSVIVSGRVLPAPVTGRPSMGSGAVIQLQRLTSGVWRTVGTAKVAADGTYRLSARADARGGRRGVQRYRVVLNQTTRVTRAVSATLRITAT